MKHAYLIMAHNEFEILEKLLILLDDSRNDIYLHIDKKAKNFDFDHFNNIVKKAKLTFTKRMDVRWGSNQQIKCTIMLLNEALKTKHSYYHFISGVDLPLKNQDEIHQFFSKNTKDFIEYDDFNTIDNYYLDRIKYYHLFQNHWRNPNQIISKIANAIRFRVSKLQKKLKVNRLKKINIEFRKGANWFSITEKTAKYITSQTNLLKFYNHTYCADEIFLQTIIYNSKLKNNLYFTKKNKTSNLRYIDWNKGNPATLTIDDYDNMKKSNMLFARKFSYKTDKTIINKIFNDLRK